MISPRNNNNKRIQQMNPTNQPTMTTMTIPTTTKNPAAKSSILAGGPPSLAPLQPKTAPSPTSGNPRHPQGMSAAGDNLKSAPPAGKTKIGAKPPVGGPKANGTAPVQLEGYKPIANDRYWTFQKSEITDELRKAWKLGPPQITHPHDVLCSFGFETARKLMWYLRAKGHSPRSVEEKFALVELTERGFRVSPGHSYAAAVQMDRTRKLIAEFKAVGADIDAFNADQAREQLAALTEEAFAEVPELNPCPFCRQSDLLEITDWTNQRPDGSEYNGDAVNCHRCDCVVPLAAWQGRTEVKP
jgi:hypothetical protein